MNMRAKLRAAAKKLDAAGLTRPCVLTRVTLGDRDPENLTAGRTKTTTTIPCKGFETSWSKQFIAGTEVVAGDRFVALLGYSLGSVVPKVGDSITIGSVTAPIVAIASRDDAQAAYVCMVRP